MRPDGQNTQQGLDKDLVVIKMPLLVSSNDEVMIPQTDGTQSCVLLSEVVGDGEGTSLSFSLFSV